MRASGVALSLCALLTGCGLRTARPPSRPPAVPLADGVTVFERANVVRMDRGIVLHDQDVVVQDGRIARIGPSGSAPIPSDALRLDARGRYLMPGLADMQVQISPTPWRLRRELTLYVTSGVTLVRNLDGRYAHVRWRDRISRGETLGPMIVTCGPPIANDTSMFGRSDDLLGNRIAAVGTNVERMFRDRRTVVSIRPEVMDQRRRTYDCVTVDSPTDWTPARYDALVAAARAMGMPLTGDFARNLPLDANLRSRRTADRLDAFVREQLTGDVFDDSRARDSVARDVARRIRASGVAVSTRLFGRQAADRPLMRRVVQALAAEGATLILSTESTLRSQLVTPGASVHHELRELVAAGLTPLEALRTATTNPAIVLGVPGQFGIVAPGARADLLLLDGNPLADVSNTERLAGVMLRGRWLSAADLQRLRDQSNTPPWRRVRFW